MSKAGVQKLGDWHTGPLERASAGGGGRGEVSVLARVWRGVGGSGTVKQPPGRHRDTTNERAAGRLSSQRDLHSALGGEEPPLWPRESKRVTGLGPGAEVPSLESQETSQEKARLLE